MFEGKTYLPGCGIDVVGAEVGGGLCLWAVNMQEGESERGGRQVRFGQRMGRSNIKCW